MGLFDWLFGQRARKPSGGGPVVLGSSTEISVPRSRAGKDKPPKVVGGLDENSLQVVLEMGDGEVTIMDRDTYDYMYGDIQKPDPAQRDLDELLPGVTRVEAIAGGLARGRALGFEVVIDCRDSAAIAELRSALSIVEDPSSFAHCACLGGPTLRLYRDAELVAEIGLQHGHSIRWSHWKHDARLQHGSELTEWLKRHGFDAEFLDVLLQNQYESGGMMSIGQPRSGPAPLTRAEQQLRLADLSRVREKDRAKALARVKRVIDAGNPPPYAYFVRGLFHGDRNDHAGAIADYSEAIRLGLRDAAVLFARAVAYDLSGSHEAAHADCTAVLEIEPEHINALNSRGIVNMRLGRFDEALADLAAVIRLQPKWHLPYVNRANLHHKLGNVDAAIADYGRVAEVLGEPHAPNERQLAAMMIWNRGKCYEKKGDRKRAEADFREALRRAPELGAGRN